VLSSVISCCQQAPYHVTASTQGFNSHTSGATVEVEPGDRQDRNAGTQQAPGAVQTGGQYTHDINWLGGRTRCLQGLSAAMCLANHELAGSTMHEGAITPDQEEDPPGSC